MGDHRSTHHYWLVYRLSLLIQLHVDFILLHYPLTVHLLARGKMLQSNIHNSFRVRSNFRIWFSLSFILFIYLFLFFFYFFLFIWRLDRFGSELFGPDRVGPVRIGSDRSGPVRYGPVRIDRFGSVRSGSIGSVRFQKFYAGFPPSCHSLSQRHFLNFFLVVVCWR